ncbi:hypothetical protein BGY98DRAFT_1014907, partial [Russula aff. rugulosa BPL654]
MGPYLILIVSYKSRLGLARRIYFAEWTKGRMRCVSCMRNTFGTAPVIAFVSKHLIFLARERDFALDLRSLHPSTRVWFHTHNRTPFGSNVSTPALHSNRLPFRSSPADAILGFEISLRRHGRRSGSELHRLAFWVPSSVVAKVRGGNYEAFPRPAQAWAEESAARHARVGLSAGQSDQRHLHDLS